MNICTKVYKQITEKQVKHMKQYVDERNKVK